MQAIRQSIFVISDLHLGGRPPNEQSLGYEMCAKRARGRLVEFLGWARQLRSADHDVHLVINGDIVDFLAEEPFEAFTRSDADACTKFETILTNTMEVWNALAGWVESGAGLTLLLGNHDLELSLPGPRRRLLDVLGPGRVEFIYDNQALKLGPVLIEHGNRYDAWNLVPHNTLRNVRAKLSRGEVPGKFPCIPGSDLVCRVMNPIKGTYRYIDLLKPETQAALPLLAVLEPFQVGNLRSVKNGFIAARLPVKAASARFNSAGQPTNPENTAATVPPVVPRAVRQADEAIRLAEELAGTPSVEQAGIRDFLPSLRHLFAAKRSKEWDARVKHLEQALRYYSKELHVTFKVNQEAKNYTRPASHSMSDEIRVVVYGHTHLVKRVSRKMRGGLYLNTGTWTDLVRLPDTILDEDRGKAQQELSEFAADIATNSLERWRRFIPSFARIDLNEKGSIDRADVYHFDGSDNPPPLDDALYQKLLRGTQTEANLPQGRPS